MMFDKKNSLVCWNKNKQYKSCKSIILRKAMKTVLNSIKKT